MSELDWAARIEVSDHALRAAREWLGWDLPGPIIGEVRSAILQGRVAEHKPNWTRCYGEAGPKADRRRYVWDEDASHCWCLRLDGPVIRVATLLLDHDVEVRITEQYRLRSRLPPARR